jgi:hypothetical protein
MASGGKGQRKSNVRDRRNSHPRHDGKASLPEVEVLHRAADHCQAAFAYCAQSDGIEDMTALLCLVDCAQMCRTTADFMLRKGAYVEEMRDLCMQQVKDAADTCKQFQGDEVLAACVDVLHDAVDALSEGMLESE